MSPPPPPVDMEEGENVGLVSSTTRQKLRDNLFPLLKRFFSILFLFLLFVVLVLSLSHIISRKSPPSSTSSAESTLAPTSKSSSTGKANSIFRQDEKNSEKFVPPPAAAATTELEEDDGYADAELEREKESAMDDDEEEEEEGGYDDEAAAAEEKDAALQDGDALVAPRSRPDLEYNTIKPLGLLYWPSGGMSNQIMELESALHMAHLLNRTIYVPMIGSHNYLTGGYKRLQRYQLFPADRLLDFALMSRWADVVPLNVTMKEFVTWFRTNDILTLRTEFASFGPLSVRELRERPEQLLLFSGKAMWHRWFSKQVMLQPQKHMAYSPYLRDLSIRLARRAMNSKPFYAIHGRLGDEAHLWEGKTSREAFVNTAQFRAWDKTLNIYLASDCPKCAFFDALKETKRIVTLGDLLDLEEVHEFSNLFRNPKVRMDMMGILDKLMCAQAMDFIGSKFSTFTWDILRYRTMRQHVFPELGVVDK